MVTQKFTTSYNLKNRKSNIVESLELKNDSDLSVLLLTIQLCTQTHQEVTAMTRHYTPLPVVKVTTAVAV